MERMTDNGRRDALDYAYGAQCQAAREYQKEKEMQELHIFANGDTEEMFVAKSKEHAHAVWKKHISDCFGEDAKPEYDYDDVHPDGWRMLPDNEPLTLFIECGPNKETKLGREWATECGRGYLAGGDYC